MKGHWVYEEDRRNHWHCSACGYTVGQLGHTYNFCPDCGADMREDGIYYKDLPIVRCIECKYWDTSWETSAGAQYHYCPMMDTATASDEYCSRSELIDDIDLHIPTEIIDSILGEDA